MCEEPGEWLWDVVIKSGRDGDSGCCSCSVSWSKWLITCGLNFESLLIRMLMICTLFCMHKVYTS